MSIKEKYLKLPEWFRWIICWPISSLSAFLIWIALDSSARYIGAYEFVLAVVHPVIIQIIFLYFLFETVPRAKLGIILTGITLRSLFLLIFVIQIIAMFLAYFGIIKGVINPFEPVDKIWWKEFIGEVVTIIASISLYKSLRHKSG